MGVCYDKLWHLLIDKKITKTELRERLTISSSTFAKLSANSYIALFVIERICNELKCTPNDILEFVPNEQEGDDDELPFD